MLSMLLALSTLASPDCLLIFGGGSQRADAAAAAARYEQAKPFLQTFTQLSPGFPKQVESATVAGLKPGYFVLVLGTVPAASEEATLQVVRSVEPGAYCRPVGWSAGPAAIRTDLTAWAPLEEHHLAAGGATLTMTLFVGRTAAQGVGFGAKDAYLPVVSAVTVTKKGSVVDTSFFLREACRVQASEEPRQVTLSIRCPTGGACTAGPDIEEGKIVYRLEGGRLSARDDTEITKARCD